MENCIVPDELIVSMDRARERDDYLTTNLYPVYRDIVRRFRPRALLEIGVRYGYSFAVALDACDSISRAIGVDVADGVQQYGGEPDAYLDAIARLEVMQPGRWPQTNLNFIIADSQRLHYLPFLGSVDLAYIDGDHSPGGCLHDLCLTLPKVRHEGVIVVDDVDHHPELRDPVSDFARCHGLRIEYLPDASRRGRFLLTRKGTQ